MNKLIMFVLGISCWSIVWAAPVIIYDFDTKQQEAVFYKLNEELRCLVCQNQNIAESNSELALDLKKQIYNMLKEGKTEDDIINFMVERYGDYVLFDPPFKPLTWLLWLGPIVLFLAAMAFVVRLVRTSQSAGDEDQALSEQEEARLKELKSSIVNESNKDSK